MSDIIFFPESVWDLYLTTRFEPGEKSILIAEHPQYGIEIYLVLSSPMRPIIDVRQWDESIHNEDIVARTDCVNTVARIYDEYIYNAMYTFIDMEIKSDNPDKKKKEEFTTTEEVEMIEKREDELEYALTAFLEDVCPELEEYKLSLEEEAKLYDRLKYVFGAVMYKEFGISVYHPMYIQNTEDGTLEFSAFPYEEIELEL